VRRHHPPIPTSAADVLERALATDPRHEALVARDGRFSYAELDAAADHAAAALAALGVGAGDVVGVCLPNTSDVVVTFHAAMRLGAVWLGINRNLAVPEQQFMLRDAHARVLLAERGVSERLRHHRTPPKTRVLTVGNNDCGEERVDEGVDEWRKILSEVDDRYPRARCRPDDLAGIAYTSGTTGRPKGVVHSHRNLVMPGAMLVASRQFGPALRKGDCAALTILNMQITTTLLVAQAGGTQVVMDRLDIAGIAAWIERERVTSWFGVPTLLHGLVHADEVPGEALASLDDVWSGGTYVPEPIRSAFEDRFGVRIHATYGLTEAPTVVTIEPHDEAHGVESSGRALPHLCVEIRNVAGEVLPTGAVGEITVRAVDEGPWAGLYHPMVEYLHQPDATAATVRSEVLYTGDIGELDAAGNLRVRDRRNALILRGGANVYPAEVERVLLEVEGVAGAAVVGVPDDRLGERVGAALEAAEGTALDIELLREHCATNLARYKVPQEWRVGALPRNAMGKVVRAEVSGWFDAKDGERESPEVSGSTGAV
jgi:acyl-CoA synthetase (AMP-forming)/AMP-acid ligase II